MSKKEWPRDHLVEEAKYRWQDLLRSCKNEDEMRQLIHEAIGWMRRQDPVTFMEFVIAKELERR